MCDGACCMPGGCEKGGGGEGAASHSVNPPDLWGLPGCLSAATDLPVQRLSFHGASSTQTSHGLLRELALYVRPWFVRDG